MALINCPSCGQRISSKAAVCQGCNTVLTDMSDEQRQSMSQMAKIKKQEQLNTQSMLAMLLFCAGVGFMYWGQPQPESLQYIAAAGATGVGFIWYIVNRVRILMFKRK
ncbi:hypothetical protein [Thalassotalea maritima]|uniref:hypothetical protein n=1 Tax=Thalassotalea maritima TaxID=3242416 RepID=UPI0035299C8A